MRKFVAVFVLLGLLSVGLLFIAKVWSDPQAEKPFSIDALDDWGPAHHGGYVAVRGFLVDWQRAPVLISNRAEFRHWLETETVAPFVFVWDTSIGKAMMRGAWANHPCFGHHAQVTGRYVHDTGAFERLFYDVDEIRVWPDDQFRGPGIVCFHHLQDGKILHTAPQDLFPRDEDQALRSDYDRRHPQRTLTFGQLIDPVMPGDYDPAAPVSVTQAIDGLRSEAVSIKTVEGYLFRVTFERLETPHAEIFLTADRSPEVQDITAIHNQQSAVQVLDNSERKVLLGGSSPSARQDRCLNKFVQVTGGFIRAAVGYPYVLYDVHEVRVFEDETYEGEGTVCYRKDESAYEYFPLIPGLY